jgi:hypothetical protein
MSDVPTIVQTLASIPGKEKRVGVAGKSVTPILVGDS